MTGLMSWPPTSGHGHEHRDLAETIVAGIEVEHRWPHRAGRTDRSGDPSTLRHQRAAPMAGQTFALGAGTLGQREIGGDAL